MQQGGPQELASVDDIGVLTPAWGFEGTAEGQQQLKCTRKSSMVFNDFIPLRGL